MRKLIAVLCLLTSSAAYGTVIVSTSTFAPMSPLTTGYSSFTITMPGGSGAGGKNRAVVIGCNLTTGSPVVLTSATLNDYAMTRATSAASGNNATDLYIGTMAVAGVNYISVFHSGVFRNDHRPCGAVGLENVLVTSPIDVSSAAISHISTPGLGFTTTSSSGMLVAVAGHGDSTALPTVAEAESTARWGLSAAFLGSAGGTKPSGLAGVKVFGWDVPNNNGQSVTHVKAASGAPDISSTTPKTRAIGLGQYTLTVSGRYFVSGASVTWNGERRATTFVNSTNLTAVILSTDTVQIASVTIRVVNPDDSRSDFYQYDVTGNLTNIWVTDGGLKHNADTLYAVLYPTMTQTTRIWDGETITPFQAKNEINGFAVVLENNSLAHSTVSVRYPILTHAESGYVISSTPTNKANVWDYRNRPITLYQVRYLPIQGFSTFGSEYDYDESHVNERMRATCTINSPVTGACSRTGLWESRQDHDKAYPDPLIPIEVLDGGTWTVRGGSASAVWADFYIPKDAPAGHYTGEIKIYEGVQLSTTIPVDLLVYPFTMPDVPPAKQFAYTGAEHVNGRMHGNYYPTYTGLMSSPTVSRTMFYKELWRHGITPIGDSETKMCGLLGHVAGPCDEFKIQLDGTLFDPTSGYANAPGVRTPVPLYSIGTYADWRSKAQYKENGVITRDAICEQASMWEEWFRRNHPNTDRWWYLVDEENEDPGLAQNIQWATWVSTSCPSPGNQLPTFATANVELVYFSSMNITHNSTTKLLGIAPEEEKALHAFNTNPRKKISYYNGTSPFSATMATDDYGINGRVRAWHQFKKKYDYYFTWETTNYTAGGAYTSLFSDAQTFGFQNNYTSFTVSGMTVVPTCDYRDASGQDYQRIYTAYLTGTSPNIGGGWLLLGDEPANNPPTSSGNLTKVSGTCGGAACTCVGDATIAYSAYIRTDHHPVLGRTGSQYSNGDGVLLYPGRDALVTSESFDVNAAFPSWRLKMFRRGINDFTYLTMAYKIDPKRVTEIVNTMVPKVQWEYGAFDLTDPSYQYGPISWTINADTWERAREELAQIISGAHR